MAFRKLQDAQVSLGALQDEMSRLIERVWHAGVSTGPFDGQEWAPAIDLHEYNDRYAMFVDVPGVDAKGVDVSHVGNALTIKGERCSPVADQSDIRAVRNERRFGAFSRTVDLPGDIDADRLSARCQGGVLEITIPKSAASMPKAVKIEVSDD